MIQSYGMTPNQKAWTSSTEYKHSTQVNKLTGLDLHTNPLFDWTFSTNGQNLWSETHRQSIRLRVWSSGLMACQEGQLWPLCAHVHLLYTLDEWYCLVQVQVYSLPRTCQCPPQTNSLCRGSNLPSHSLQDLQQTSKHCYFWANRIWGMLFCTELVIR